jgi:acyl carrier protein
MLARGVISASRMSSRGMSTLPKACFLSEDAVRERVKCVVGNMRSAPENVADDAHFVSDLKFDSLHRKELTGKLENEFCVRMPKDAKELLSVGDATKFFATHPKAR